ncbi:hypothetical protein VTI74DRAFT_9171 [Chaetomium olivicolor]
MNRQAVGTRPKYECLKRQCARPAVELVLMPMQLHMRAPPQHICFETCNLGRHQPLCDIIIPLMSRGITGPRDTTALDRYPYVKRLIVVQLKIKFVTTQCEFSCPISLADLTDTGHTVTADTNQHIASLVFLFKVFIFTLSLFFLLCFPPHYSPFFPPFLKIIQY